MSPGITRWQHRTGVALVADLTQHLRHELTTAMHHLCTAPKHTGFHRLPYMSSPGRFSRCIELSHRSAACAAPVIPLSFSLAAVLPGGALNALATARNPSIGPHLCPRYGVDYQVSILFAPHAFAPQRQFRPRVPPSPLVSSRYLRISRYTGIRTPYRLESRQFDGPPR